MMFNNKELCPGSLCKIVRDPYGYLAREDLIGQLAIVIAGPEKGSELYTTLVCNIGNVLFFFREMLDDTEFTLTNLRLHIV